MGMLVFFNLGIKIYFLGGVQTHRHDLSSVGVKSSLPALFR